MKPDINYLKKPLYFDGAFGTMLQKKNAIGLGELPPVLNITKPDIIREIYNEYVSAGSDVVTTNTFEANRLKLKDSGYSVDEIVKAAVAIANSSKAEYSALDIGPTGQLLEPMGNLSFEEAYDIFSEIVKAGEDQTDFIILETFSDLLEIKAALLAAKDHSELPVIASMTFSDDGRTFTGTDPITAAITLQELGADIIGVNCSLGPGDLLPIVKKILSVAQVPVIVQANAGLPQIIDNKTVYTITPEEYSDYVLEMAQNGVSVIGGCCGTDPDYIRAIKEKVDQIKIPEVKNKKRTALTSSTKTTYLDDGIKITGERLNPTGRDNLKEALRAQSYDIYIAESLNQEREGADILDVNVGLPGIDEAETLKKVVKEISSVTSLPLQIDTPKGKALKEALKIYPGIPIINSVNGSKESMDTVLPLAKKYGACVIGLLLDEEGIPKTVEKRLEIAQKIIDEAAKYGIDKSKIIFDALCVTASAQQEGVMVTLETLKRLKEDFGVLTTLGVSNVSFGLPERDLFNSVYLTAALNSGLNLPIVNPGSEPIKEVIDVYRVINNEDRESKNYIENYSNRNRKIITDKVQAEGRKSSSKDLKSLIIDGLKEEAISETIKLLETVEPEVILNDYIISALNEVGERFEKGEIFLPQLMQSAGAVQGAFELIKKKTASQGLNKLDKGKILLATVKGDIHDIGKNIVKMMLENYGYTVYDLGTDVDAETIITKAKELDTPLIGLSALMTTTVESMKEIIEKLRENGCDNKVMVGGAVLTEDYSKMIGADCYCSDAQASVRYANEFFSEVTNE